MFLILTAPRTGSELLTQALAGHPQLRVESEILNPYRYQEWRKQLGITGLHFTATIDPTIPVSSIIYDQDLNLVEFIKTAFTILDGFKITYDQITQESPAVDFLKNDHLLKAIFLRRDYIDSAISYWFAIKSQIWQLCKGGSIIDRPQIIDLEFVRNYQIVAAAGDIFYPQILKNHIIINYEDLINNWDDTTNKIQSFLGIESLKLEMKFDKRLNQPLRRLVLNYDELHRQSMIPLC